MQKVEIREATLSDLVRFWGRPPQYSMLAYVALLDGEPIAVSGIERRGYSVVFSEMKEPMRGRKKDIVRMAHVTMEAIQKRGKQVVAFVNPNEPTAQVLITHFGFKPEGKNIGGETYSWAPQQGR